MIQLILALLLSLPAYYRDAESPDARLARMTVVAMAISSAVDEATCTGPFERADWCRAVWGGKRAELAALLVTIGWHESAFSLDVANAECGPLRCDHGNARHYWQQWRGPWLSQDDWDSMVGPEIVPTTTAARAASWALGTGLRRCRSVQGAIGYYANGRCSWPGAERRMALFRRAREALRQ